MSRRVLITGGAGFIGFHLAKRLLDAGYTLHLVDNHARGICDQHMEMLLSEPLVTFSAVDLLDRDAVLELGSDFYAIFHLAAIVGVAHVLERPYVVLVENTQMLDNVIALASHQTKLSRLLFASTSEVYAGTLKYFDLPVPTPEQAALSVTALDQPRTSYMLSKIVGEVMCQQSGVPFTIFRPHNIYGPRMGMAHVIPELLQKAWEGTPSDSMVVHSADHKRTFCYINDAVEMLKRMLETDMCTGQTLNLGTQSPEVTIREVAQTCIDATGKVLEIEVGSATPGSPVRRAPDMSQTRELLNYQSKVSLSAGVAQTWAWYCEHIFEGGGQTAR